MYQKTILNNGLTVITHYMPNRVSVCLGLWIRAGSRYEPADINGISHFLEHLVFKGTKKRSCEQIKQSIEGLGGSLNAFTAEELTCYLAKVPQRFAIRSLDTLSDMVFNSRLDAGDIEMERKVILEEIKMYKDLPGSYVLQLLTKMLWPNHPLGANIAGEEESVNAITKDKLMRYKRRYYRSNNIVLCACGNIRHETLLKACGIFNYSRGIEAAKASKARGAQNSPRFSSQIKDSEQTHLALAWRSLSRNHPARFILGLLHIILGANMSSRLFRQVRERRGLAYEIGTSVKLLRDTGAFIIHAGIDNRRILETLEVILKQLRLIKKNKVSAAELKRAKEYYIGQLSLNLEDTVEHMLWLGDNFLSLNKFLYLQDAVRRIEKINAGEIQYWAGKILRDQGLNLALVGPLKDKDKARIKQLAGLK